MSFGLYKTQEGLGTRYFVLAQGNDRDSVNTLVKHARKVTLDELMKSKAHNEVLIRSRSAVESGARRWAEHHGYRLSMRPELSSKSFVLRKDTIASKKKRGATDIARNVYLYYNGVNNTRESEGGTLVSRGALGGLIEVRAQERSNSESKKTYAWANDMHSMMPMTTGLHDSRRKAAMHYTDSNQMRAEADRRIKWDGDYADYNPEKERQVQLV